MPRIPSGPFLFPRQGTPPASVVVPGQGGVLPGLRGGDTFGALQAVKISPLIYGVNVIWGENGGNAGWDRDNGARARKLAQALRESGATVTRIGISWADIEREKGKYDWGATDRFVRYVRNLKVTPICVMAGSPDWAADGGADAARMMRERDMPELSPLRPPAAAHYADLERFTETVVRRYKETIRHWEFWTEPDGWGMPIVSRSAAGKVIDIRSGGDSVLYTGLLKRFSQAARRGNPMARVAVGGLRVQETGFLSGLYAAGARPYFDALAVHPYRDRDPIPFDWIDRCRDIMVSKGDETKPIWITEWGWPAAYGGAAGLSEGHQARLVREAFQGIRARPFITLAAYHALTDWRTDEADPATIVPMGLISISLKTRPAYATFREAALNIPATPARSYNRISLAGSLPIVDEAGVRAVAAEVRVDAQSAAPGPLKGEFGVVGRGFVHGRDGGDAEALALAANSLKAVGTNLIRFDPFPDPAVRIKTGDALTVEPDWSYSDRVFDAINRIGAKSMVNFATMPTSLAAPTGNTRMPRDAAEWTRLIAATVQRYSPRGASHWELSHEPNAGDFTQSEWLRLYEVFARAVTGADPKARVGGPAVATFDFEWIKALIDRCVENKIPIHFITWHAYDQAPEEYARQVEQVRSYLGRYPSLKETQIIIGEWNYRAAASADNDGLPAAAHALSVIEKLASVAPVQSLFYQAIDRPVAGRSNEILTGRWGAIASDGRPKPVYHAFSMLEKLAGQRLDAQSTETDIHVLATRRKDAISVLLWNDSTASEGGPDVPVRIRVDGIPWTSSTGVAQRYLDSAHGVRSTNSSAVDLPVGAASASLPPGDPEITVVLSPNSAMLLELRPEPKNDLTVTLGGVPYVAYGGGSISLTATVRNSGSTSAAITPLLRVDDARIRGVSRAATRPVSLAAGETRTIPFQLDVPAAASGRTALIQFAAGGRSASAAVKIVPPIELRIEPARTELGRPGALPDSIDATARVTATVSNRADRALKFDITSGKFKDTVTVPARGAASVKVPVTVPDTRPGAYQVPVQASLNKQALAEAVIEIAVPAASIRAARAPRIDATLDEWSRAVPVPLTDDGESEHAGVQALTLWDDTALYVAAVVPDATHFQPFPPQEMTGGDALMIAIDTPAVRKDAAGTITELGLALSNGRPLVYRFAGVKPPGVPAGVVLVVRREASRTIYEASIPWTELGSFRPKVGARCGIQVSLRETDGREPAETWPPADPGDRKFMGLRFLQ